MKDDGLENAVRRALLLHARPVRARADLGRRSRTRSSPSATARRSSSASATASSSSPPTSRRSSPHARRRLPRRRGDGGHHARRRRVHRLRRPRRSRQTTQRVLVGPDHGGEGRLQALHAQGDLRAAAGRRARRSSAASSLETGQVFLEEIEIRRRRASRGVERVAILACGTSWHAALVGKFLIEQLARVPVEVDYGSEYRYRDPIVVDRTRWRSSSRSRARPPTRSRRCARRSRRARAASPSATSSAAWRRARPTARSTRTPGPEIGVASTKAFTSQLVALLPARAVPRPGSRHAVARRRRKPHIDALLQLPLLLEQTLKCEPQHRGDRRAVLPAQRLPLPRPRHQLPDRARRRAEAEGDLVHPRRGLSGRRDEARADRADRRADAGRRRSRRTTTCSRR